MIILTMVILRYYSWWEHYNSPLNNCPPDNCPLDNCSPDNCHLEQLCVGQFPPRTIARRQLPPGSCSRTIHVGLMAKCKQHKLCKKEISKELMLLGWHPTRWWDWCLSEDEKNNNNNLKYFCLIKCSPKVDRSGKSWHNLVKSGKSW